jgi:hypothetical protein
MPHPIKYEDRERFAIHETSHAVIAIDCGLMLLAIRLDLGEPLPGAIWKIEPTGKSDQSVAKRELRVFAAGFLGEERRYGKGQCRKD